MASRDLTVHIIGDSRSLERAFTNSSKGSRRFGRDMDLASGKASKLNQGLRGILSTTGKSGFLFGSGAFVATASLTAGLTASSNAASNMGEQLSKTNVVFGKSAKVVKDFATNSLALANDQALEAASSIGALLTPLGLTGKQAAETSTKLTQLGIDFSSFFNTDLQDSLTAIRSGLVGEVEPLRRYGVLLSQARVQQEALRETGKKHAKQLTNQELVQARVNLIFRDSTKAQGDFARTQGGLANQQRILARNIRNLEIAVGRGLNPVISDVTKKLNHWLSSSENQKRVSDDVTTAVEGTAAAFGGLVSAGSLAIDTYKNLKFAAEQAVDPIRKILDINDKARRSGFVSTSDSDFLGKKPPRGPNGGDFNIKPTKDRGFRDADLTKPLTGAGSRSGLTADQRNTFFDNSIARLLTRGGLGDIKAQVASLQKANSLIGARMKVTKDVTRLLSLEDELLQNASQIKSLNAQQAADALSKRQDAMAEFIANLQLGVTRAQATASFTDDIAALQALQKGIEVQIKQTGLTADLAGQLFDAQQNLVQARKSQRQARQFRELGLTATGDEITPGVANLQKRLKQLAANISGTKFDTPKLQSQLAKFRKVLSEKLTPPGQEVRAKIKSMMDDIADELKKGGKRNQTKFRKASTSSLLAGIGLSPDEIRKLRPRLAQLGAGGTVPGRRSAAFAGAGTVNVNAPPVYLDGQLISRNTTRHQQRADKRKPSSRRGPYSGHN